jgi:hypothetical protein
MTLPQPLCFQSGHPRQLIVMTGVPLIVMMAQCTCGVPLSLAAGICHSAQWSARATHSRRETLAKPRSRCSNPAANRTNAWALQDHGQLLHEAVAKIHHHENMLFQTAACSVVPMHSLPIRRIAHSEWGQAS